MLYIQCKIAGKNIGNRPGMAIMKLHGKNFNRGEKGMMVSQREADNTVGTNLRHVLNSQITDTKVTSGLLKAHASVVEGV